MSEAEDLMETLIASVPPERAKWDDAPRKATGGEWAAEECDDLRRLAALEELTTLEAPEAFAWRTMQVPQLAPRLRGLYLLQASTLPQLPSTAPLHPSTAPFHSTVPQLLSSAPSPSLPSTTKPAPCWACLRTVRAGAAARKPSHDARLSASFVRRARELCA